MRKLAASGDDEKLDFTWEAPEDPAGPIEGYVVQFTDKTTKEFDEFETNDLIHSEKNLPECLK